MAKKKKTTTTTEHEPITIPQPEPEPVSAEPEPEPEPEPEGCEWPQSDPGDDIIDAVLVRMRVHRHHVESIVGEEGCARIDAAIRHVTENG
jgi:hypothetical protein